MASTKEPVSAGCPTVGVTTRVLPETLNTDEQKLE